MQVGEGKAHSPVWVSVVPCWHLIDCSVCKLTYLRTPTYPPTHAPTHAPPIPPSHQLLVDRYIDLVNEKLTDTPSYYLIHCWKMGFRDLVETLRQHFALTRQPEEEVVIWADFFCVNQHRPMGPSELSVVADIMRSIEKVGTDEMAGLLLGNCSFVMACCKARSPLQNKQIWTWLDVQEVWIGTPVQNCRARPP